MLILVFFAIFFSFLFFFAVCFDVHLISGEKYYCLFSIGISVATVSSAISVHIVLDNHAFSFPFYHINIIHILCIHTCMVCWYFVCYFLIGHIRRSTKKVFARCVHLPTLGLSFICVFVCGNADSHFICIHRNSKKFLIKNNRNEGITHCSIPANEWCYGYAEKFNCWKEEHTEMLTQCENNTINCKTIKFMSKVVTKANNNHVSEDTHNHSMWDWQRDTQKWKISYRIFVHCFLRLIFGSFLNKIFILLFPFHFRI